MVETLYNFTPQGWKVLSNQSRIFMFATFTIGRLGVPIFLFLSGALLLKKNIESDVDVINFYKKSWLPLFIVNECWVIIYNIFFFFTNQLENVTMENIVKELLCIKQVPVAHMWYFPMILGMYLGIPFVIKIVKSFSFKSVSIILSAIIITSFFLPTLQVILNMLGIKGNYQSFIALPFLGGTYGMYIIFGYYIVNKNKIKLKSIWIWLIILISFLLALVMQLLSYSKLSKLQYGYNIWYNNVFLFICSTGIFILFNRMNIEKINQKYKKIFTYISKISLALFFIHYILQYFLRKIIIKMNIMKPMKVTLLFISVFALSTVITFILSKIKFISKYILRIKK